MTAEPPRMAFPQQIIQGSTMKTITRHLARINNCRACSSAPAPKDSAFCSPCVRRFPMLRKLERPLPFLSRAAPARRLGNASVTLRLARELA